jgi:hypothetical protein
MKNGVNKDAPVLFFKEETKTANCPLCGRQMSMINDLKEFSIQLCNIHGIYGVDKPTNDVWVLQGFDINMIPIKVKWYTIDDHRLLTLDKYREMVKLANVKRLEALNIQKKHL